MKIHFLGTSDGKPSKERYCSSMLIETGDSYYMIDAGAPVCDIMLRNDMPLKKLKAVFTTHTHSDHSQGLLSLVTLTNWCYKENNLKVFLSERNFLDALERIIVVADEEIDKDRITLSVFTKGEVYRDDNISVTAFSTDHLKAINRPSYGFVVEAEGKRLVFSGDMSWQFAHNDFPVAETSLHSDMFVCECAHFDVEKLVPYLKHVKTDMLTVNHIYPLDKIDKLKELDGKFGYKITVAKDGMTVDI